MHRAPGQQASTAATHGRMPYEAVIGLEIHAQLLTTTKIFCGCETAFGAKPNTHVCPVCLGFPGALPVLNQRAVEYAIRAALALGCTVEPTSIFARKNYFYPDLPKGYRISQYDRPLATGGFLAWQDGERSVRVGITRIHMEEDAGKSLHEGFGDSGDLELHRPESCGRAVGRDRQRTRRAVGDRCGAVLHAASGDPRRARHQRRQHGRGQPALRRQRLGAPLGHDDVRHEDRGEERELVPLPREGDRLRDPPALRPAACAASASCRRRALFDSASGHTFSLRSKEDAHDYRYFPEPDLPPLTIAPAWVDEIARTLPELPEARRARFVSEYGLPPYDAAWLTQSMEMATYFEDVARATANAKASSNWVMGELARLMKERSHDIAQVPVTSASLARLIALIDEGKVSGSIAKGVLEKMYTDGRSPDQIIEQEGLARIDDEGAVLAAVTSVLATNADAAADYRAGKAKSFGFLVGQVMKASGGKANPALVNAVLKRELGG